MSIQRQFNCNRVRPPRTGTVTRDIAFAALLCVLLGSTLAIAQPASAWPDAKPTFPIEIDASRQGFVDQLGVPFMMVGDSPWSLMVQLDDEELERYFSDRSARGFNTLLVEIAEPGAFGGPANTDGHAPFQPIDDFTRPVEAYWARVDRIVDLAEEHGFLLLLTPMYVGYACGNEGWAPRMQSNSVAAHQTYARFLAGRYASRRNILWLHGGDVDAATCGLDQKVNALANTLRANTPGAIHSGHCTRGESSLDCYDEPWLDANGVYSDCQHTAERVRDAYRSNASTPHYYVEGIYENESGASDTCLMSQMYWPLLGGLQGSVYGNRPIWFFGSGWEAALDSSGAAAAEWSAKLMKSRPWAELVPDYDHTHVTAGYGNIDSASYAAAAVTADRRTLIAYAPVDTTLRVDLTKLAGPSLVAWRFDPATGESVPLGTFAPTGSVDFALDGPAVLVIDDAAAGFGAPGTEIHYGPAPATIAFFSVPSGRTLLVDGVSRTTPFDLETVAGASHTVEAVNAGAGNQKFTFAYWSDLGAQSHVVDVPQGVSALSARFDATVLDPLGDEDGDGLSNRFEYEAGLDAFDASDAVLDGDGDGLDNLAEQAAGTNPALADSDSDGLDDAVEIAAGTNPTMADTDADTLDDGDEVARGTNPLLPDTDGDGLDDAAEVATGSDPLDPESPKTQSPSGLVLHYPFDAATSGGVVTDVSGAGHDGRCTAPASCPAFVNGAGRPPGAASFAGANTVVVVDDESAFDFTVGFSVAFWMQTGAFDDAWTPLVGKGDSAWSVDRWNETDRIAFTTWSDGSADSLVGPTPIDDGVWHHVAVVYDGTEKRLYIDGSVDAAKPYGASIATNEHPLQLGRNAEYAAGHYDGLLDDVRVYERALTRDEVSILALAGTPPTATIAAPVANQSFRGGTTISFAGSASDAQDGPLPASALDWAVELERDGVTTTVATSVGVSSGSFAVPTTGSAYLGDVRYVVRLRATDSDGETTTTSVTIEPERAPLSIDSMPSGLTILVDGVAWTTPFSLDPVVGMSHTIEAVDSSEATQLVTFRAWTDFGPQRHAINVPATGSLYVAFFRVTALEPPPDEEVVVPPTDPVVEEPEPPQWQPPSDGWYWWRRSR